MDTKIMERSKMKKRERKTGRGSKIAIIVCSLVAIVALGIGVYFGAKAIYENGVSEGKIIEADEIAEKVKALGTAVSEKADFQKDVNAALADLPTEVNAEGIDAYIAKLTELGDKINTENVKSAVNEYLGKWQAFKETYASEDNAKITEEFNNLKTVSEDTAKQIKSLYDEAIKGAVQDL